jgi:hypothetical protein
MRSILTAAATFALAGVAQAQDLAWHDSVDAAKKSGKPIFFIRMLGDLKGKT